MKTIATLGILMASIVGMSISRADDIEGRIVVSDPRALMVAAIDSPAGEAHGIMIGKMTDLISKFFSTEAPLYIDVTTQRRFTQAGCSRLKVLFSQEGVKLKDDVPPRKQTVEIGINYCRDGLPPKSTS